MLYSTKKSKKTGKLLYLTSIYEVCSVCYDEQYNSNHYYYLMLGGILNGFYY